jgi:hypothetical protein
MITHSNTLRSVTVMTVLLSSVRIQALRDGPAGSLLESFAQALSEAGYVRRIARRYLRAAEHFIYWTDRHDMPLWKVNEQSFARFDRHLSRCRCPHYGHADQWTVGRGCAYVPNLLARQLDHHSAVLGEAHHSRSRSLVSLLSVDAPATWYLRCDPLHLQHLHSRVAPAEPKYEEFRPRTIWSLSNAFTSAFKELAPIPQFKATAKFRELLEARFSF